MADLASKLAAAEARVAELEAEVARLREGIGAAMAYSGNRWGEWGERAENVGDMLSALLTPQPPAQPAVTASLLRPAAQEALDVLAEVADAACWWSEYDIPVGLGARVDAAKARLAGALAEKGDGRG